MKVSVLFPALGRHELFHNALLSLRENTRRDVEIVVVADDTESFDIACNMRCHVIDRSPVARGALWAWNRALQICTGDIIVPSGNDHKFYPGWLEYALESHREKLGGYGVVGMNDLAYNGNIQVSTMFLFDRKWCKEQMGGIFAPPCYEYIAVDLEWNDKAKMLGRFYWDERSVQEHIHSAHGKRPFDELDEWKVKIVEQDMKVFEERKAQGFPLTWEPII